MKKPEHWYKRDPDAALDGMQSLSLEERGAYNTILDLIYSRENRLRDDDRFIAGWLGVDLRIWRRLKLKLVGQLVGESVEDGKKLYIKDGFIRNKRADIVIGSWLDKSYLCSEAAVTRWSKSSSESKENNNMTHANAMPRARIEKENKKEKESITPSTIKEPPTPKGGASAPGVYKNGDWKGIIETLNGRDFEAAKKVCVSIGWDIYFLAPVYNEFVKKNGPPRMPGASFIAWIHRYTKDKKP